MLLFLALFSQAGLSFSVLAFPGLSLRFQGDCSQLPGPLGVGENGLCPSIPSESTEPASDWADLGHVPCSGAYGQGGRC